MSRDRGKHEQGRPETSATLSGEALGAPPGPRSVFFKVLSGVLSGALLVLLFLAVIPQLGDLQSVWEAMSSIPPAAIAMFVVLAYGIRLLSCAPYSILTPGLALGKSFLAREISAAVSNVVPGPSGTAAQFVVLRSWGVRTEQFVRATISVGVANNALVFSAPGLFFVVWVLAGMPEAKGGGHAWVIGIIAVVVAALTIGLVGAIAKSEPLARRVGRLGERLANPLRRVAGKDPVTTWPDRCVALRTDTIAQLRAHGVGVLACVIGGYALNALLLIWCMYACGITRAQLPLSLGLLLYSVSRLSTSIAITPGGVGVVEIVYTAVYVAVLGEDAHNAVFAAVLVYRGLTYALPILDGLVAYPVWRVMRHHELRTAEATAS